MAIDETSQRRFTVEEANAEIPSLAARITRLRAVRDEIRGHREHLDLLWQRLEVGDPVLVSIGERQAALDVLSQEFRRVLGEIDDLGVVLRDLDPGLADFPASVRGMPVYLCWRLGEPEVLFWHGVTEGFAGRKPLHTIRESPPIGPN